MAKLVWRYSDDAIALIENVKKFCVEEKESGTKLSLDRVGEGQHSPASADLPLRELSNRRRRHGKNQSNHHVKIFRFVMKTLTKYKTKQIKK